MNELDLTPFKVEFDREITIDDLLAGDICHLINNYIFILVEPRLNPKEEMYFIKSVGSTIDGRHIVYAEEVCPNNGLDFAGYTDRLDDNVHKILAIYRINKFKY